MDYNMSDNDFFYSVLKEHVLSACGVKSISIDDCREISVKIFEKDKNYLSEKTIISFFGLNDNQKVSAPFVMDSLAKFIGYTDWERFKIAIAKRTQSSPVNSDGQQKDSPPWVSVVRHDKPL